MKRDTHQTVTNAIIKMLETGTQPWAAQWKNGKGGKAVMPTNCITGKPYRGINVVLLWGEAQAKGYENSSWMTFQQAVTAKAKLRKGEKGTSIVFWSKLTLKDEETGEEEDRMYCKEYTVFNVDQFETLPEKFETGTVFESDEERIEYADQFLNAVGADIRHGGNSAFFAPSRDIVVMKLTPLRNSWRN
ncbi:ArdC-like ssDNA-binding domain-containing protein [Brevundimonas sp. BH3]|uniref:ArdC-like ssDNA-binding domain-containing protein n=1 Tax=Brevundimonas sp. BH3 TaxID=3133089 RepID=UPI0032542F36